jgi:hypothetical protein
VVASATRRIVASCALGAAVACSLVARDAHAFKPEGHVVIEVMAYREMGTGPDSQVLAALIRDGAIEAPVCFWDRSPDCIERFESDPLAWWPAPHTDAADMILARQFSHSGQCYHFMAQQDDEGGPHWVDPMNPRDPHVTYGLMWDAYLRCTNQLEWIVWRVIQNPIDARKKARGMYELMHAVMDSYSRAHTERDYFGWSPTTGTDPPIEYLKVWQPTVGNPFAQSTLSSRHEMSDDRDEHYIQPTHIEEGRTCSTYVAHPYGMPPACLSQEGRLATNAIEDLMRLVVTMRAKKATRLQVHAAWMAYVAKHLPHAATLAQNPTRPIPAYEHETVPFFFFGTRAQSTPQNGVFDGTLFGRYVVTSGAIDPLTLAIQAEVGTRSDFSQHSSGARSFMARQDIDAMLSLGNNLSVGFTPFSLDYTAGQNQPSRVGAVSRAIRVDLFEPLHLSRVAFSVWAPVEYSWLDAQLRWSVGFGISGGLLEHAPGVVHRAYGPSRKAREAGDVAWYPPQPWDSELRSSSGPAVLGAYVGATAASVDGKIHEGIELDFHKRNWWGALNTLSYGFMLEDTLEFTNETAPHTSLGAFASGRWYLWSPFGLIVDAGVNTQDLSPAQLHPWSFQSRGGLVLTISRLDIIIESPTVPRYDWVANELLSARLSLEGFTL